MHYLLDTNIVGYVIKDLHRVRERLVRIPMSQIAISVVTEAELLFGVARRPDAVRLKKLVDEFLVRVHVMPWDSAAARHYADIRAALERSGDVLGNLDLLIAAQARAAGSTLVSADKTFHRVPGLRIEDWTKR